jgi:hypothetical protein
VLGTDIDAASILAEILSIVVDEEYFQAAAS